jgi:hypothetical protein
MLNYKLGELTGKPLKLENNKCSKEEFESMSILDKRTYIIQTEQEDTMWYQKTIAKIQLYSFIFGVIIAILYIIFSNIK